MRFADQVVIVTGGAHGIGRACVEAFAAEGAAVVIADVDAAGGEQTARAIAAERAAAAEHVQPDDIVVMKTRWERQRSPRTPEFWTEAPYMSRAAAKLLLGRPAGGRLRLPAKLHYPPAADGRG